MDNSIQPAFAMLAKKLPCVFLWEEVEKKHINFSDLYFSFKPITSVSKTQIKMQQLQQKQISALKHLWVLPLFIYACVAIIPFFSMTFLMVFYY